MRKIAYLSVLGVLVFSAFFAAKTLPNNPETSNSRVQMTTKPTFDRRKELALDQSLQNESLEQSEESKIDLHENEEPETEEIDEVFFAPEDEDVEEPLDEKEDYERALSLLNQGKNIEFLSLVGKKQRELNFKSEEGHRWLLLLLDYAVKNNDEPQLVVIYRYDPSVFDLSEDASLLLGKALIDSGKDPLYWALRKQWEKKEGKLSAWTVLDADAYFFQGRRDDAVNVLKSKEFAGKDDVQRLYRLALLHVVENPKEAFDWLTKAKKLDPENVEVLSYRGKMLEMAGKNDQAFADYYAAWKANPFSQKSVAQLSDFYFRQKDFPRALEILSVNLEAASDPTLMTKALFLGKVVEPIKSAKKLKTEQLSNGNYVQYLAHLKPWEFWNDSTFERVNANDATLESEQSAYWLRLLSYLRKDEKQEAWDLLRDNPFINQSWNPELEVTLKEILAYQLYGSVSLKNREMPLSKSEIKMREILAKGPNSFIQRINAYSIKAEDDPYLHLKQEDKDLLATNLSLVAALLETKWIEAALDIYNENDAKKTPGWLALGLAKGILNNKNLSRALEFAKRQNESPEMNLFIAEALIRDGKFDPALKILGKITDQHGDIATSSAWLRALTLIERGDYSRARAEIQLNSSLDQSLRGKELLAKAALLEGKPYLAEEIYGEIAGESFEAKSYLARRHFENGNIPLAKKLTLELIEKNPSNEILKKNITMIEKAEK